MQILPLSSASVPQISVIVPTYNGAAFIADTITSVLNQTSNEWDICIVDDGSTDDTVQIVTSFVEHDERIRLLKQTNTGVSHARNRGLSATSGDYVLFLTRMICYIVMPSSPCKHC